LFPCCVPLLPPLCCAWSQTRDGRGKGGAEGGRGGNSRRETVHSTDGSEHMRMHAQQLLTCVWRLVLPFSPLFHSPKLFACPVLAAIRSHAAGRHTPACRLDCSRRACARECKCTAHQSSDGHCTPSLRAQSRSRAEASRIASADRRAESPPSGAGASRRQTGGRNSRTTPRAVEGTAARQTRQAGHGSRGGGSCQSWRKLRSAVTCRCSCFIIRVRFARITAWPSCWRSSSLAGMAREIAYGKGEIPVVVGPDGAGMAGQ
jgi:hypothetical protein